MSVYFYHGMHYPQGHNSSTCEYCSYEKKSEIDTLRTALAASQERIAQLEGAALEIRDKWIPALRRDANEGDKTLCHAGGIAFLLAHVVPLHAHPPAPSPAKPDEGFDEQGCRHIDGICAKVGFPGHVKPEDF